MQFPDSFFEDEVRNGFYVPSLMKRAWAAQLEALADISRVCAEHNILWFADRGTLLGAVRHGGYIPWDDDLDICMLRDDYTRFNLIAKNALPQNYYIPPASIKRAPDRLHTTIWNAQGVCLEKEHLEKYHGFPYAVGIDIFVLDYIAPDSEDEELRVGLAQLVHNAAMSITDENQNTEEKQELVSMIEELLNVTFDRNGSLKEQLFPLLENVLSLYTAEEADEVAYMPNWILGSSWKFPHACYRDAALLPFEGIRIPVPVLYDTAARIQFGDYKIPFRAGGGHNYPYFRPQEELLTKAFEEKPIPFQYRFSADDLRRNIPADSITASS
ncbi:MAG: LicD family protein [Lachnospiraceae bacterium]|nr:LicD family protein [Lachnospiraceae bacterium]